MHADVIALKPRVVHIMAGTNDIAQNTGPMLPEDSKNNFMAMCEIAQRSRDPRRTWLRTTGIQVLVATRPPAQEAIAIALNEWLRAYAKEIGATYADYAAALTDANGNVKLQSCKGRGAPDG